MDAHRHQLIDAKDAAAYITGGHGRITLVSEKTGTRYTYRFGQPKDDKTGRQTPTFVGVLTDPDNVDGYTFLGTLWGTIDSYRHGRRSRVTQDAPSVKAIKWTLAHLAAGRIPDGLTIYHEGICGRCGRTLTVPESIEAGMGPVCAARAA